LVRTANAASLVAFLLCMVYPQGLLGLNTAPLAHQPLGVAPQRDVGPDWLNAHNRADDYVETSQLPGTFALVSVREAPLSNWLRYAAAGRSTAEGDATASPWERARVYALEFGGAAIGTCVAAAASYAVSSAAHADWTEPGRQATLGLAAYAVSSALLSSSATHFIGVSCHRRRTYTHALIGGTTGGVLGAVLLRQAFWRSQLGLVPIGLALAPLGSVAAYNIWRRRNE
jgi:hypothetical protein